MGIARPSLALLGSTAAVIAICLTTALPAAAAAGSRPGPPVGVGTGDGSVSVGVHFSVTPLPGGHLRPDCGGCYEWT